MKLNKSDKGKIQLDTETKITYNEQLKILDTYLGHTQLLLNHVLRTGSGHKVLAMILSDLVRHNKIN